MTDDKAETQKYDECSRCDRWGAVFSYKRIAHEMMCGYGQDSCLKPSFEKPSGFIPRKLKSMSPQ